MTEQAISPSDMFPAVPGVSMPVLDGWTPVAVVEAVVTVMRQTEPGQFRPNVVAAHTRHPNTAQRDQIVAEVVAHLDTADDVVWITNAPTGDGEQHLLELSFVSPGVGTLAQISLLVPIQNGPFLDVIHVTGSCSGEQVPEVYSELRQIVASTLVRAMSVVSAN